MSSDPTPDSLTLRPARPHRRPVSPAKHLTRAFVVAGEDLNLGPLGYERPGQAEGHIRDAAFVPALRSYCGMEVLATSEEVLIMTLPSSFTVIAFRLRRSSRVQAQMIISSNACHASSSPSASAEDRTRSKCAAQTLPTTPRKSVIHPPRVFASDR